MNKAQKAFYEVNTKTAHNLRREGETELADKLCQINNFLKEDKISQALEWAWHYDMPIEFILDMKDLFCGFNS